MATDVARLALQIDVTGAQRAKQALAGLQDGSIKATRATDRLAASTTRLSNVSRGAGSNFRFMRGSVQQVGFQIGDFATQVSSGQSAIVAFGQQASQLAGIMGPGGALLGAVIAIGSGIAGAFARSMMTGSDSTENLTEKTRELVKELGRATERQREFINVGFQKEILEQERQVRQAKDTIVEMNARLEDFRRAAGDNVPDAVFNSNSAVKSLREEIEQARLVIDNANSSTEAITKAQKEFWEAVEESGKKTEETTDKIREMVEAAEQQAATIGLSARATATYQAALAGANAEQILAIDQAYQRIEAEKLRMEQIKQTQKEEEALAQMRAQGDPAFAEFNRYADQIDQIEQFNITAAEKDRLREQAFMRHQENMAEIARKGTNTVTDVSAEGTNQLLQQQQQLNAQVVSTFGNVLGAIRGFTEQGTAEWVAMTIAQKGIMAGQAIMAANLAAAQTLSASIVPGDPSSPLRAVALAETIRNLGYVNAGLIVAQGVGEIAQSFDGGGYTGNGPRSGGLDGKGGFMAMMHPQETVIDHTRGQGVGGGTVINIHNAQPGTRTEERTDTKGRQVIDIFIADIASGGPMSKAVQGTYGLRRQGR